MTAAQDLGDWGESQIAKAVPCQVCHRNGLSTLKTNFPSLDLICRDCGAYMAQVKTVTVSEPNLQKRPNLIRGAGWNPLQTQIAVGVLRDLYVVGASKYRSRWRLEWIDRVPGHALLANAHIYEKRIARISGGARLHPMFNIRFDLIPEACVQGVYARPTSL